jgi:hypothetical protein
MENPSRRKCSLTLYSSFHLVFFAFSFSSSVSHLSLLTFISLSTYWALTEAGKAWAAENCAGALGMKKKPLTKSKSKKEGGSGGSVVGGGRGHSNNGAVGTITGASGSGRTYNFREVRGKKRKYEEDDDDDEEEDEMEEKEEEEEEESDAHAHSPSLFRGFVSEYSSDTSQDSESDGEREHEDNQLEWDEPSHSSSSSTATLEKEMDRMRKTHELLIQQFEQTQLQFTEALDEKNRLEKNHRELQVLYSKLQEEVKKLNSQVFIYTSTPNSLPLPLQTLVQSPPDTSPPPLALSILAAHSTAPSSSNSTAPPPVRQPADLLAFSKTTTPSGPLRPTLYATNIIGALKAMIEIESKAVGLLSSLFSLALSPLYPSLSLFRSLTRQTP